MEVEIGTAGTPSRWQGGLACTSLDVRLGDASFGLPALSATHADYAHARSAGITLNTSVFNYHLRSRGRPFTDRVARAAVEKKIRDVRASNNPQVTILTMGHHARMTDSDLAEFYAFQARLGLPISTTTEKNPMQDLDGLRGELEEFDRLASGQERFPSLSIKCDLANFGKKLRHVTGRYAGLNLHAGGHVGVADRWRVLSEELAASGAWCNVIWTSRRYETIKDPEGNRVCPSNVIPALLYGGHSYCISPQPRPQETQKPAAAGVRPRPRKIMRFSPETWCYEPAVGARDDGLARDTAHAESFNAVQEALAGAREEIRGGALYSRHCPGRLGLRVILERIA